MDNIAGGCTSVQIYSSILRQLECVTLNSGTKRALILFTNDVSKKYPRIAGEINYLCGLFLSKHCPKQKAIIMIM